MPAGPVARSPATVETPHPADHGIGGPGRFNGPDVANHRAGLLASTPGQSFLGDSSDRLVRLDLPGTAVLWDCLSAGTGSATDGDAEPSRWDEHARLVGRPPAAVRKRISPLPRAETERRTSSEGARQPFAHRSGILRDLTRLVMLFLVVALAFLLFLLIALSFLVGGLPAARGRSFPGVIRETCP